MGYNDSNVTLEDVRIVFRNFAGKKDRFNPEGKRSFSVVLTEEQADRMQADGWNVKRRPPREEGDERFNYIKVAVSYMVRPPRIVLISSRGRTTLDEETCELLDWADVAMVDVILHPYKWDGTFGTGIKAYLYAIYVTIAEDALERKYADIPEIGNSNSKEIGRGQLALEEGFIDGEVISEEFD
jgi:hypothetical protein